MKKIKQIFEDLDLNYKNELAIIILLNFFFLFIIIFLFIFIKDNIYFALAIILMIIANLLNIYRLNEIKNDKYYKEIKSLIFVFNYALLNLYSKTNLADAFKNIKDINNIKLNNEINNFIESIKDDSSINPFLAFAHNYSHIKIEEIMILFYKVTSDNKDSLNLLNNKINELNIDLNNYQNKKENNFFSLINFSPIIAVLIMVIITTLCIVFNIQGK